MTATKINCSTECPLDGMRRTTLRGLLEDYGRVRFLLPGGSAVQGKDSSTGRQCRTSEDSSTRQYRTNKERDPGQYGVTE
jgi:hypothetical protein